ncbi:MAG: hypothetical protein RMM31_06875 [Anaerolineae bacterium]|nr:hypothetical protein [Anaerolineae bacterium]
MTVLSPTVQMGTFAQPSASLTAEQFFSAQVVTLLCWVTLGAMAVLLFLGLSDQVVIFFDANDVFWSLMPFISLVGSFIVMMSLLPPPEVSEVSQASIVLIDLVMIAGLLFAFISTVISFRNAVLHNRSLVVGLFVGVFKVCVALLMSVLFVNYIFKAPRSKTMILFIWNLLSAGVLGWLWTRLVNGPRVYLRRGWAVQMGNQLWIV